MGKQSKQDDPHSERPPDSDFQQQNLKSWQPLLTPSWVIATFFLIGIVFVPIGAIILSASAEVVEVSALYQDRSSENSPGLVASVNITADMEPPVYFYYELTNYYQNHRRYVKSRSDAQLRGEPGEGLSSCDPLQKNGDKDLYPCGLIASSYFNDSFTWPNRTGSDGVTEKISWTDTGIAWPSDVADKFKDVGDIDETKYTRDGPNGRLPNVDDEDFIVWMRTAGLPNFKKLRYIINTKLYKDDVFTVHIDSTYPVAKFEGTKAFTLIKTHSWLGGKNDFLGWAYIVVGAVCILLAFAFLAKHKLSPRVLGDMKYFNFKAGGPGSQ
jgi:hypothetical protein